MPKYSTNSHIKGIISDPDVADKPFDSVFDSYNIDFYGRDYFRKPILKLSNTEQLSLPTGYKISDLYVKKFTDGTGTSVECIIVIACKSGADVKIYINKWFNPSTDYANNKNGSTGWISEWTEITSQESFTASSRTYFDFNKYVTLQTGIDTTSKGSNYYKGQFLYDNGGNCVGIITNSNVNADCTLTVRLNSYVSAGAVAIRTITNGNTYFIERFPVTVQSNSKWTDISNDIISGKAKVSFADTFNSVKICFGKYYRLFNLCFLQERKYFNNVSAGSSTHEYKQAWNGFWFGYDCFEVANKLKRTSYETVSDTTNIFYSGGASSYSVSYDGNNLSGATDFKTYFESDFSELGLILEVQVFFNLVYVHDGSNPIYGFVESYKDDLWAYTIELDGFQNIFLKTFLGCRFTKTHSGRTHYFKNILETKGIFKIDFDRRITSTHAFYERRVSYNDNADIFETKKFNPYQLDEANGGTVKLETDSSAILSGNTYALSLNPQDNKMGVVNPYGAFVEPSNYNSNDEKKSLFEENPRNTGLGLIALLNQYWYSKINVRFDTIAKLGENLIGINVNSEDLEDGAKFGEMKIVASNLQFPEQRQVNAQSIFVSERAITVGDSVLVGGKAISETNVAVFTENTMYDVEMMNERKLTIRKTEYKNMGLYSHKAIALVLLGSQYGGTFWASRDSIFLYANGKYVDLLNGRWRSVYRSISESNKRKIIAGFYPERKEVYFTFDYQNIFIYNLEYDNWKRYKYPATTGDRYFSFTASESGQMYFHDETILYSTLSRNSTKYKDNQTVDDTDSSGVGTAINVYMKKVIDSGSDKEFKIPNMLSLYYDCEIFDNDTAQLKVWINEENSSKQGHCNIEGTSGAIIDLNDNRRKYVMTMPIRNSFNFYNVEIESYVSENIISFSFREMQLEDIINLTPQVE